MKKIINATPHAINLIGKSGETVLTVEPSGTLIRVSQEISPAGEIEIDGISIPVTSNTFGEVVGLPEYEEGTILIVSALVASACKDRKDLALVNEAVRDEKGRIIGCRSLSFPNR